MLTRFTSLVIADSINNLIQIINISLSSNLYYEYGIIRAIYEYHHQNKHCSPPLPRHHILLAL